ncbi:transmembrane protease serine 3, partial [Lates japonicus]
VLLIIQSAKGSDSSCSTAVLGLATISRFFPVALSEVSTNPLNTVSIWLSPKRENLGRATVWAAISPAPTFYLVEHCDQGPLPTSFFRTGARFEILKQLDSEATGQCPDSDQQLPSYTYFPTPTAWTLTGHTTAGQSEATGQCPNSDNCPPTLTYTNCLDFTGHRIEVVSVTEEDLPIVETPNTLNVSPLGSFAADPHSESNSAKPEEPHPPAAPSPTMPITKVQPFLQDDDLEKSWKSRLWAHRLELLIASCLIVVVILTLGIGLG